MPRFTDIKKKSSIIIPKDMNRLGWKCIITESNGTEHNVTSDIIGNWTVERVATDGLSNFTFLLDNTEGKYKDKFATNNIVDFYYDFKDFLSQDVIRFRGYIDSPFNNFAGDWTLSIEGRDAPKSSTNEHFSDTNITIQFTTEINILDCWLGTTGTADSQGNYPNGILYNGGLILKIYDTQDKTWKDYKDLTSGEKTTLQALTAYSSTHIDTHIDTSRLTISNIMANEGKYNFRIYYDPDDGLSYLYVSPTGAVINDNEPVSYGQNLISLNRFGKDTIQECNRFKQQGYSDGDIITMSTKEDTVRQSTTWIKDKIETASSLKTMAEISAKAVSGLNESKDIAKSGQLITCALPSIQPGEKFKLNLPYVINDYVLTKGFSIVGGMDIGMEFTHDINSKTKTFEKIFKEQIDSTDDLSKGDNPNGMKNSVLFDFSVDGNYTLENCEINNDGQLIVSSGSSEAVCLCPSGTADSNISKFELRVKGEQLLKCTYKVRNTTEDSDWVYVQPNSPITVTSSGSRIELQINLNNPASGVNTIIEKAEVLYT